MPRGWLKRAALPCCLLAALAIVSGVAKGALVRVNGIVVHANGSYQPQTLPRHGFAPIDFQGFVEITAQGGGQPPALEEAVFDFDRDGHLNTNGLATCPPERIAAASPAQARRLCAGAMVGSGRIEALIALADGPVQGGSPLTLFNGPRVDGHPTVIFHSRNTVPNTETFVIVAPIERRPGAFRYRVTLDLPPIAGGRGVISRIEAQVGRRFVVGGKQRSYVSARCSDGILHVHGRFTFADGTIIDGSVEKACMPRQ